MWLLPVVAPRIFRGEGRNGDGSARPERQAHIRWKQLMPVFTRYKDEVLVLTADGDYTAGELERVGARAFAGGDGTPAPLLLDLSGAAGLDHHGPDDLTATGEAIGAHRRHISRLAVVVPGAFAPHFGPGGAFARAAGVDVRACPSHAEALAWLRD